MSSFTTEIINIAALSNDPVTQDVRLVFQFISLVVLCSSISCFGIVANIVNISVFVKQGFKDTINISLLGLAVSDLSCVVTLLWVCICYNFLICDVDVPFAPLGVMYVTGGWIHVCFNRITSLITAFITLERCLCIAMPLKVKTIITPFRTKVIITCFFISTLILFTPFYFVNRLEWKFNIYRNKSILDISFTSERETVESVTSFIHSVFMSSILLISVTVCTIILVVKLNKKTKWRESNTNSKPEKTNIKDKKVVKMVTMISAIFLVCYVPPAFIFLVMVFYPELSVGGGYENMLYVVWSVLSVLDVVNASVNIFVYFNMSTKFRVTLHELFLGLSRRTKTLPDK